MPCPNPSPVLSCGPVRLSGFPHHQSQHPQRQAAFIQGEVDKRGAQPLAEVGHAYPRYAAPIPQVPADDAPEEAEAGEE